jgi:hypothetical protein
MERQTASSSFAASDPYSPEHAGCRRGVFHGTPVCKRALCRRVVPQAAFLRRNRRWCEQNGIPSTPEHLEKVRDFAREIPAERFRSILRRGHEIRTEILTFDALSNQERAEARKAGFHVKAAVGIVLFVVLRFTTEAIPLPMVAFSIG